MKLVPAYDLPSACERTEWVRFDGRLIGLRIGPGFMRSPIATEIRFTHYPEDGATYESNRRVRPIVCNVCGDNGDSQRHTFGPCEGCYGYAELKNLHVCAFCGQESREVLPCAPREVLNHVLLLQRMHPSCAVESTVAHVRERYSRTSLVVSEAAV